MPQTMPLAPIKVTVKRGMPTNADAIASFISQVKGQPVSRMDIMIAFGNKSYLLAQDANERVMAVVGWQVENLITRVDEFYLSPAVQPAPVIHEMLVAIELASKDLQSEVSYIFLPANTPKDTLEPFMKSGYEVTSIDQIKIPAWREAVQELVGSTGSAHIFTKKLREDRVLKPI
jgi:membrane-associated protease RseP (regulator of RpoE activity)